MNNKENQNGFRDFALRNGFRRVENVKITQEDVNIVERNIATKAKENERNRNRTMETAKKLIVV